MALFEGYERRINQINPFLVKYGISSLEEAEKICVGKGVDVRKIVKDIQPISFENAGWAYLVGAAAAIKKGLKNAADMVPEALPGFDFAITEDCFVQGWGERVLPFIAAGKAVFAAEYTDTGVDFQAACAWGRAHAVSFIQKNRILTAICNTCS